MTPEDKDLAVTVRLITEKFTADVLSVQAQIVTLTQAATRATVITSRLYGALLHQREKTRKSSPMRASTYSSCKLSRHCERCGRGLSQKRRVQLENVASIDWSVFDRGPVCVTCAVVLGVAKGHGDEPISRLWADRHPAQIDA
jgi:hypothetical protein